MTRHARTRLAIGVLLVIAGCQRDVSLADLRQGMPYAQARSSILASGWQTEVLRPRERPRWGTEGVVADRDNQITMDYGYPELEYCIPTGTGGCSFRFIDANGRRLLVVATDTGDRTLPVARWTYDMQPPAYEEPTPTAARFPSETLTPPVSA